MKKARNPAVLREALDERGVSQRELARLAQCSHSVFGKLIEGRSTNDETAKRIARRLGRPVEDLFEDVVSTDGPSNVPQQVCA